MSLLKSPWNFLDSLSTKSLLSSAGHIGSKVSVQNTVYHSALSPWSLTFSSNMLLCWRKWLNLWRTCNSVVEELMKQIWFLVVGEPRICCGDPRIRGVTICPPNLENKELWCLTHWCLGLRDDTPIDTAYSWVETNSTRKISFIPLPAQEYLQKIPVFAGFRDVDQSIHSNWWQSVVVYQRYWYGCHSLIFVA